MADRFFVTISARDEQQFRRLLDYDLDLFASRQADEAYAVDGLIGLDEVQRLVEDGYQVLVAESEAPKVERGRPARADEWLRLVEGELDMRRRERR